MVQQLGAGSCVQVLQLLHWDLRLHIHDAQDERRVLDLENKTELEDKTDDIQCFSYCINIPLRDQNQ